MAEALSGAGRWLRGDGSYRRLEILSLVAAGVIGLISLPQPLWPNQAVFALFGSGIADGDVLYRDLVDLKQPGIFLYYLGAQIPFGRSAVGIHLVELATWLIFGAVLQQQARGWFERRWMAATLPLAIIGTYYLSAEYGDLTQVEALVNIPLLAAVMLGMPDNDGNVSAKRYFLAGLATGVVALLKLPYIAIPVLIWVPTLVRALRSDWRAAFRLMVLPATAGLAVLVVPVIVYFAAYGLWNEVWDLYFKYPSERSELWPRPGRRLYTTGRRTVWIFAPYIALIAMGALVAWRRLLHRRSLAMVAWCVIAIPLFLVQQWWRYHAFLWLVPMALLGWFALEAVLDSDRGPRNGAVIGGWAVVVLLLLAQVATDGTDKVTTLARNDFALTTEGRDGIRSEVDPSYSDALEWAAWNDELGQESAAWTLSASPAFLFVAGQDHHLPLLSWPVLYLRPQDWERIDEELMVDPPSRLLLAADAYEMMTLRSPSTLEIIERDFCVARDVGAYQFLLLAGDPNCP